MPKVVNTMAYGSASSINKILIVGPSWLGDMVMAQSLFIILRQQYPDSHISVLAPSWCADVLLRMPQVDEIIIMPVGHGKLQIKTRWQLAAALKTQKYDLSIVMPGSLKSALIPWLARIPVRRGFVGEKRYGLLNDIRHKTQKLPLNVQHYAALAYCDFQDWQNLALNPPYPMLKVQQNNQQAALDKLSLSLDRPILGLCPGAEYGPAKRWPAKYYASVAKTMIDRGYQVWIFGSLKDKVVADEIDAIVNNENVHVIAGQTSIGEAIDLMALCRSVVTNDSGLMHVAAALSLPLVAVYGSSSTGFTPPLSKKAHCVSLNLSCSPCFKRECPLRHTNCLNNLTPETVLEKIFLLL